MKYDANMHYELLIFKLIRAFVGSSLGACGNESFKFSFTFRHHDESKV
jgi:hypothetical protein